MILGFSTSTVFTTCWTCVFTKERNVAQLLLDSAHSRYHDVAIWKPVGLLFIGAFSCELVHGTKIERNVAQLSLTTRTISRFTVMNKEYPRSVRFFIGYSVR